MPRRRSPPGEVDVLVAGAGFAGAVIAERLAAAHGLRCLVVERRDHVGGIAADELDGHGVRVHRHGPHWFRTSSERVRAYLSRFTAWHPVAYRVVARARGRDWSFPINLRTYEQLIGRPATAAEMEAALARWRVPLAGPPRTSEELILSRVGRELFELFYRGYTRKQWGVEASALDPSVCGRVPVRTDRDDRLVTARFQALPAEGYARLFARILDHERVRVVLGAELRDVRGAVPHRHLVYTGALDEYFDGRLGALPWRSLRFERTTHAAERVLPAMQVNYPDGDVPWTREVEAKWATGQVLPVTTVVRELPQDWAPGRERYYPVPAPAARALAERYRALAAAEASRVTFLGRLASYRYLDMDAVVEAALDEAGRLGPRLRAEGAGCP